MTRSNYENFAEYRQPTLAVGSALGLSLFGLRLISPRQGMFLLMSGERELSLKP